MSNIGPVSAEPNCGNCKFSRPSPTVENALICARHTPDIYGMWPPVMKTRWCGEYERNPIAKMEGK
jgi:hypothetical protein